MFKILKRFLVNDVTLQNFKVLPLKNYVTSGGSKPVLVVRRSGFLIFGRRQIGRKKKKKKRDLLLQLLWFLLI